MKTKFILILSTVLLSLLSGCSSQPSSKNISTLVPLIDSNNIAHLYDAPAIQFSTSGWDYTNTSNPFLLTPNSMINAMIGVSRLAPGKPLLNGGPIISKDLSISKINELMAIRLKDKTNFKIQTVSIKGKNVIHSTYIDNDRQCEEYSFELNGYLVHIILSALPGNYYESGSNVASEIINSIQSI